MIVVAIFVFIHLKEVERIYGIIVDWIKLNPYLAVIVLIATYIVSIISNIPTGPFHPSLGFTYSQVFKSPYKGFLMALPISFIGSLIGSTCAMLISRYFIKDCVKAWGFKKPWFKKNFKALDMILKEDGIKSMLLFRLAFSPITISSYAIGITSIKTWHYFIGSFSYVFRIGIAVYVGCRLYVKGNKKETTADQVIFVIEMSITVLFTILIGVCAKRTM